MADRELPKVFVTRALLGDAIAQLRTVADVSVWPESGPPSPEELARAAADADGLLTMLTERVDDVLLDRCPRLRVVANMAVGYDNLDLDALTKRHIRASNTPDVLTEATADLTFALLLASARRIVEARDLLMAGGWTTWDPGMLLGLELAGSTLGIVGFGRIGRAVARRALAFSMRVVAWSRTAHPMPGVEEVGLGELLETSDVVSIHVALDRSTHHLIGARELEAMKPSAILVNTSRGAVIDQAALGSALRSGTIAAAALDVFEHEPVSLDDPILSAPNLLAIPHLGSATVRTREKMAALAADNLIAGLAGRPMPSPINFLSEGDDGVPGSPSPAG